MKEQHQSGPNLKEIFMKINILKDTAAKWKSLKSGDKARLSAIIVLVVVTGYLVWSFREDTISSMLIITGGMSCVQAMLDYFEDKAVKAYISVHARLIVVMSAFLIWYSKQ